MASIVYRSHAAYAEAHMNCESKNCNTGGPTGLFSFTAVVERCKSMERRGRKSRRGRRRRAARRLVHHRTKTLSRRAAEQSKRRTTELSPDGATLRAAPQAVTRLACCGRERKSRNRWRRCRSDSDGEAEEEEFSSI